MIDKRAVEALIERVRRDVDSGMLPAAQFAVALNGEIMVSEALGDCTTATRFHTYSAIKPAVSLTVMELAAEGLFDLAAPVSGILGSFGSAGKQDITVSQVLLHSGGFPNASLERHELLDRAERLAAYASWQTEWQPGACYEYHPLSAHWVLADIITEATGSHFADAVTQRMMEPAGCSRWLAIAEDQQSDVADVTGVGTAPSRAELAAVGLDEIPGAISEELLTVFNLPWLRALGVPGGGGIARAEEMALWYGAVMLNSDGLLRPEVRSDAMVVRQSHPDWTGTPANRSHAFVLAGDDGRAAMRGHGHGASAEAFGHGGAGGQIAWADPRRGLAFAYFTNGLDRNDLASARRRVALSTKALACARMNT
ncbi:MAG: serine hydrolase [Acidimicrobiaceae bacterium]|nr:serine hydrolase [Acidimicrobiaceae bacterium]MCY4176347.1 serine hydrolase [Acidimicrobiaceae bacterium]MCY4279459.1 serine hydrolase [Acidimicrobiaceae bacterium]MCY4294828.1 serine hydrolase [Acidimicrobiaceae bacterium]